ncbi:MAG: hypothetical protein NT132_00025 [Microbacterium sp.]|uniref:hypothetical protein n=1 Tax=Microbacterium sp. TaxID=51671 RepID=UPI0026045B15|nr:hypothetical protein [Microbacterium sp.]MCX6500805.1 hypothetical protein [Microbacterium sp.]
MSTQAPPPRPPVRPAVALAFCLIGFFALIVAGLGLSSLATDTDVISTPGLGQVPGVIGVAAASIAFAGTVWGTIRRPHPSFGAAFVVVVAAWLAYVLITGIAAAVVVADIGAGMAVTGSLAIGWPGLIVAAAALIAGWTAIALVRTRAARPQWPWERDDEE